VENEANNLNKTNGIIRRYYADNHRVEYPITNKQKTASESERQTLTEGDT
jgi:hypothetical protein